MLDCKVIRFDAATKSFVNDHKLTSIEKIFSVSVNGRRLATACCSPKHLDELAVGMLAQSDLIEPVERRRSTDVRIKAGDVLDCMDRLLSTMSITHDKTNGVHSGVLFNIRTKKLLVHREDVGRHNVFDKIYGWSILNSIDLSDKMIVFSGRCSTEMINKLERMNVAIVAAKSVPTTLAVERAQQLGITLAARFRRGSFCIYTYPERIVLC